MIESLLIEVESVEWRRRRTGGVMWIIGGRIINRQHVFDDFHWYVAYILIANII